MSLRGALYATKQSPHNHKIASGYRPRNDKIIPKTRGGNYPFANLPTWQYAGSRNAVSFHSSSHHRVFRSTSPQEQTRPWLPEWVLHGVQDRNQIAHSWLGIPVQCSNQRFVEESRL